MGRTLVVSQVDRAPRRKVALSRESTIRGILAKRVEQIYESAAPLVACDDVHPLVKVAHDAFYEHRPIAISPDDIWYCIAQGFATHVNLHAEALRKRFVQHAGKLKLVVNRPDFQIGQPNPWPEAFAAFSSQIATHVGKLRDLVVNDFSTTTPLTRASSEVCLMDAFQAYFEYEMRCGCGIPEVTLLGTVEDWRSVRRRAQMLSEYELAHWTDVLLPILDRFISTAEGNDEAEFWQSMFHYRSGSMGSALTGWIQALFPYIKTWDKLGPNPHLADWKTAWINRARNSAGPGLNQIPSGLSSAPVKVSDERTGETHEMRFVGGMFGVIESADGVLSPEFGWAVVYDR